MNTKIFKIRELADKLVEVSCRANNHPCLDTLKEAKRLSERVRELSVDVDEMLTAVIKTAGTYRR
jgi:hypothetical protein